ncbi:zinc ribbon domain-containing protein [Variovorax sp. ZS18.2.2]|uniref:zinc ribbon domain-containing protein n=1 Tax=Variovorax sp. ZS18.2.2 TaxID=2971255 RepID=UPI00215115D2|nr:zinc ribbon domain-containing protein [Variovorax sp. ZS18.2.2]MCR6478951.1 zinc ribbon domain-containing protein [Variovorax sp. ZS18.2.2]
MASICPVCSTENRESANFCKSCGTTLSATASRIPPPPSPDGQADREWATTAPAQLRAPTIPAPLFDLPEPAPSSRSFFGRAPAAAPGDERTVILAPGQPAASASSSGERSERKRSRVKVPRTPEPPEPPLRRRGLALWLGLLVVAVVMVVAGWYGYGSRKTAEPVEIPPPVAAPAPAPAPAAAPPVVEPPPAESVAPLETPAVEAPAADAAPAAPVAAPKPAAKPLRKQATATVQPAAPEAPAPAAAAAPQPAAPAAPAEPQALCGDRNFVAKAQCMAAQCLKPEFKAHAQCEAVRRQQRIDEEKRNPTLIN